PHGKRRLRLALDQVGLNPHLELLLQRIDVSDELLLRDQPAQLLRGRLAHVGLNLARLVHARYADQPESVRTLRDSGVRGDAARIDLERLAQDRLGKTPGLRAAGARRLAPAHVDFLALAQPFEQLTAFG